MLEAVPQKLPDIKCTNTSRPGVSIVPNIALDHFGTIKLSPDLQTIFVRIMSLFCYS